MLLCAAFFRSHLQNPEGWVTLDVVPSMYLLTANETHDVAKQQQRKRALWPPPILLYSLIASCTWAVTIIQHQAAIQDLTAKEDLSTCADSEAICAHRFKFKFCIIEL